MENEKMKVEKVVPVTIPRRQFMQLCALAFLSLLAEKLGLRSEAASVTNEALYSEFVNDFISGTLVKDAGKNKGINFEWFYFKNANAKNVSVNVKNNYYQCVITDSSHNPII